MREARVSLPSSNRTCGFTASGSRRESRREQTQAGPPAGSQRIQAQTFHLSVNRRVAHTSRLGMYANLGAGQ